MKTANDIIKKWSFHDRIPTRELESIIEQAIRDIYNEAIDDIVSMSTEEDVVTSYQSTVDGVLNIPIHESRYVIGKKRLLKLKK